LGKKKKSSHLHVMRNAGAAGGIETISAKASTEEKGKATFRKKPTLPKTTSESQKKGGARLKGARGGDLYEISRGEGILSSAYDDRPEKIKEQPF